MKALKVFHILKTKVNVINAKVKSKELQNTMFIIERKWWEVSKVAQEDKEATVVKPIAIKWCWKWERRSRDKWAATNKKQQPKRKSGANGKRHTVSSKGMMGTQAQRDCEDRSEVKSEGVKDIILQTSDGPMQQMGTEAVNNERSMWNGVNEIENWKSIIHHDWKQALRLNIKEQQWWNEWRQRERENHENKIKK